jgi:hypothetical protein
LWRLAVDSSDAKVQEKATLFLIRLYSSVAFELESRIPEFEDSFLNRCVNAMKETQAIISQRREKIKDTYEVVTVPHS